MCVWVCACVRVRVSVSVCVGVGVSVRESECESVGGWGGECERDGACELTMVDVHTVSERR